MAAIVSRSPTANQHVAVHGASESSARNRQRLRVVCRLWLAQARRNEQGSFGRTVRSGVQVRVGWRFVRLVNLRIAQTTGRWQGSCSKVRSQSNAAQPGRRAERCGHAVDAWACRLRLPAPAEHHGRVVAGAKSNTHVLGGVARHVPAADRVCLMGKCKQGTGDRSRQRCVAWAE